MRRRRRSWPTILVLPFAGILTGCEGNSPLCGETNHHPEGYPVIGLLETLDQGVRTGAVRVIAGHGTNAPESFTCKCASCPPGTYCGPDEPMGILRLTITDGEVLLGPLPQRVDVLAVFGGGFPDCGRAYERMQDWKKNWKLDGVYIQQVHDSSGDWIPPLTCEGGVQIVSNLGQIKESWMDDGGPGWFTSSDVKALLAWLKTNPLPAGCAERLEVWKTVTGSPLPADTVACWESSQGDP